MTEKIVTGILWWKPEQWKRAKQVSTDGDDFENTYFEWLIGAEKALKNFRDQGLTVYKIEIDLDKLVKWCKDQNMPLNGKARTKFTSMKVKDHHESKSR
jgi:hypothetical protein